MKLFPSPQWENQRRIKVKKCNWIFAHIKANANKKKSINAKVKAEAKKYQRQLDKEIAKDREAHGKKPLKDKDDDDDETSEPLTKEIKQSTTDPESGMFHKGEHEKQFAYVTNTACDRHNFILDFVVGAGNIHDSVMFDDLWEKVVRKFPKIDVVAIDAGYKTPWIMKQVIDGGRIPAVPYIPPAKTSLKSDKITMFCPPL